MSKIGKKPIEIPTGVTVKLESGILRVTGQKGELTLPMLQGVSAKIEGNQLLFNSAKKTKQESANWGTISALARNAIEGVSAGFKKVLEIEGVGFKAALEGKSLTLNIGFSHPVKFAIPEGVTVAVEKSTTIIISGIDKHMVGQAAAEIRALKKPEPYKGKGIRYQGEVVRRKAGKKVAK